MPVRVLLVKGMACQSCVNAITDAIKRAAPLAKVAVDLHSGGLVTVEDAPEERAVVSAIERAGFDIAEIRER